MNPLTLRRPPRRPRGESIVPMINIVFLLLVFFLLTATIAQPDPLDLTPPEAEGEPAADTLETLHIAADGRVAWGPHRDDAIWPALAADPPGRLTLLADASLDGTDFARLLARLAETGVAELSLTVRLP